MIWNFEKYKNRIAVITDSHQKITYNELLENQNKLCKIISPDSIIVLMSGNTLGSLLMYIACFQNNRIPIMLSAQSEHSYLESILQSYQARYLWMPADRKGVTGYHKVYEEHDYILWEINELIPYKIHEDLALLIPTSGSTGNQKLVKQAKKNILHNTKSICRYLSIGKEERAITTLPMCYTYGLSVINTHLYSGGSIILTEKNIFNREFWGLCNHYSATSIAGVPYTYQCLKKLRIDKLNLNSLRTFTQAGGKLSPELQEYFGNYALKNEKRFFIMYGQTEATARISYLPYERCLDKIESVGISVPDSKIYLEDNKNQEINLPYRTGEIICKGEQVCFGYAQDYRDLKTGDSNQGLLHTGDIGYFDEDGYLYITGRKNRISKIFGVRIDLNDVEQLVWEKFKIEVVCIQESEKIYLFTTEKITGKSSDDITHYLQKYMKWNNNIFHIEIIGKIPRTESGKIDYKKLAYDKENDRLHTLDFP